MTARERNLFAIVGIIMILGLGFNYLVNRSPEAETADTNLIAFGEASLLLKKSRNLENQNKVVTSRLDALEEKFFSLEDPDEAEIKLLKEVERIATKSRLMVEQKSPRVPLPNNVIGVLLAGKSAPDSIYTFLQETTQSKIALKIKRLQLHSIEEQRLVDYQMVVVTLLIEKRKKN